jgi:hypothetical protein
MSRPVVEIEGFRELQELIKKIADPKDKRRELLLLLRQIARPTLQEAKRLVPVYRKPHLSSGKRTREIIQPGNLKKSLGFISGKSDNPTVYVGARVKGGFKGWYAHFVHDPVNVYRKGFKRKRRGVGSNNNNAIAQRYKHTPFLRKAYQATDGQVTADAERKVAAFIQRRIDKLS